MEAAEQPRPSDRAVNAYVEGRARLAEELIALWNAKPAGLRVLSDLLWSDSWADADGLPHSLFPAHRARQRYALGPPTPDTNRVERCGDYLRFKTTTNWALDLTTFRDVDDYFSRLSKSMKKKLKRYVNGAERWKLKLEAIQTPAQMDRFIKVFRLQWPESDWENAFRPFLYEAYAHFEKTGRNKSYLMVDEDGVDAVAALGYYTDKAYNLHLLARQDSKMDFLSPGYCATYALIKEVLEEKRADFFFMGPGNFEYKERFMAQPLPIYRYEQRQWTNLPGILRLYHRATTQHKRRG